MDISKARLLRKNGFFTFTNLLDVQSSVQKAQFDVASLRSLQRSQLAFVASALGNELAPFVPVAPDFFDRCAPRRAQALASAYGVDANLAQIEAQIAQVHDQLANVKGSSIAASAVGEVGNTTDININNRATGWRVEAGLNVSLPTHARDEERASRAEGQAQLEALAYSEKQRRVEIESALDAALDNVRSAQTLLEQAQADERARDKDLRTEKAAFTLLRQNPQEFLTVHAKRADLLVAQNAVSVDRMNVLLQAADLLLIAPAACGGTFDAIPPLVLPAKGGRAPAAFPPAPGPAASAMPPTK